MFKNILNYIFNIDNTKKEIDPDTKPSIVINLGDKNFGKDGKPIIVYNIDLDYRFYLNQSDDIKFKILTIDRSNNKQIGKLGDTVLSIKDNMNYETHLISEKLFEILFELIPWVKPNDSIIDIGSENKNNQLYEYRLKRNYKSRYAVANMQFDKHKNIHVYLVSKDNPKEYFVLPLNTFLLIFDYISPYCIAETNRVGHVSETSSVIQYNFNKTKGDDNDQN